jgi:hypothetical protein
MSIARDEATKDDNDFKEQRMMALVGRLDRFDLLLLQESWLVLDLGSHFLVPLYNPTPVPL